MSGGERETEGIPGFSEERERERRQFLVFHSSSSIPGFSK
jgi:hypothetical protein